MDGEEEARGQWRLSAFCGLLVAPRERALNDILLLRLLAERAFDDPGLLPLLAELAGGKAPQRLAFLGYLPPLLEQPDPRLRAAALRVLHEAEGVDALRLVVHALSDEAPEVWSAALDALRLIAREQPMRWAHAVFHPRVEIRRATLAGECSDAAASLGFYLIADPECRDLALGRFVPGHAIDPTLSRLILPRAARSAVLEMSLSGALSPELARTVILGLPWADFVPWAVRCKSRSAAASAGWLAAAEALTAPGLPVAEGDELDELCALFFPQTEGDLAAQAFFARLAHESIEAPPEITCRLAATLLSLCLARSEWPAPVAAALAEMHPRFLLWPWVPRAVRRASIRALYRRGDALARRPAEEVELLIRSPLAEHEQGGLDLWAVGGMLLLFKGAPLLLLFEHYPLPAVIWAFDARLEESAELLSFGDLSHRGVPFLMQKLSQFLPATRPRVWAIWALTAPIDQLDALKLLGSDESLELFGALLDEAPRRELTSRRAEPLALALAPQFGRKKRHLEGMIEAWLSAAGAEPPALGALTLVAYVRGFELDAFVALVLRLDVPVLRSLLGALPYCTTMPFGVGLALAQGLARHPDPAIKGWGEQRLPSPIVAPAPVVQRAAVALTTELARQLRTCADADLPRHLESARTSRSRGVAAVLLERLPPAAPLLDAAATLVGVEDPPAEVDRAFLHVAGVAADEEAFLARIDGLIVGFWQGSSGLSILGHAALYRWESHAFVLLDALCAGGRPLAEGLDELLGPFRSRALRSRILAATANVLALLAYRDRPRLASLVTDGLGATLLRELAGPAAMSAADSLVFLHRSGVARELLVGVEAAVRGLLPDLSMSVRERLAGWVDSTGLAPAQQKVQAEPLSSSEALAQARASRDVPALVRWCLEGPSNLVHESALRLIDLGSKGLDGLVRALVRSTNIARCRPLIDSIGLWPEGPWLRAARAGISPEKSPEFRFRLALALAEHGDPATLPDALAAACAAGPSWFTAEDWLHLTRVAGDELEAPLALAASPQPHAYTSATRALLDLPDVHPARERADIALLRFLDAGTGRLRSLRREVALAFLRRGRVVCLPLLIDLVLRQDDELKRLAPLLEAPTIEAMTRSVLLRGSDDHIEGSLLALLGHRMIEPDARDEALGLFIAGCSSNKRREQAVRMLRVHLHRAQKLRQLAETFAWGVLRGRELTGQLFSVEMIGGQGLGYTRLNEARIYVTPLPILRRESQGRELVEALILHEFGHHMFHKGEVGTECWKQAETEHIQGLLNLVADEHLERNLRALDASFGDRLKLLAAYAFQHSAREVPVEVLLDTLQSRAFAVLSRGDLQVARDRASVSVSSGGLLLAMERSQLSFARFMRALRMGLGNRQGDPLVARGLDLFRRNFRKGDMTSLLQIARELRAIFGNECRIVEMIGGHEGLCEGMGEQIEHGDGIEAAEVEREVQRILNPRKRKPGDDARNGGPFRPWLSVNPETQFEPITAVEKIPHNPTSHATYAVKVARLASAMRRYLEELGLASEPVKRRLQGNRFDPSRAQAMVLRGDPRVLIARRRVIRTDLFLGVLVDCSGSMAAHQNIETAKLFAVLLAEACAGLAGVDVRVLGFTDQVIYDAGTALRCGAHGFVAGGGNNDAAALWHLAGHARKSRRKARVLVMVSDGLPTECSVAALRAVVQQLTVQEKMVCAQVAVAPLAEICFPHHVLLDTSNQAAAVRAFGEMVGRLVRRSLG
jgi:hypothetical protein